MGSRQGAHAALPRASARACYDVPGDRDTDETHDWRVEHERRRQELRRIYVGVPDLMLEDLERQAMTEAEVLARSGALALVVYVRRRRRKAQEPPKP